MTFFKQVAVALWIVVAAVAAGPTAAQSTKLEKAREVFRVFQGEGIMEQVFDAAFSQISTMTRQGNPELPSEVDQIIRDEVLAALKESLPLLMDQVSLIYAEVFTEEELDAMLAFYTSPAGQSMIKKMPQMMGHTMQLSQQWGMALFQNLPGRVEQRLKAEDYDL